MTSSSPALAPPKTRAAAFFDVDGTLVGTTIVHYYVYFRRRRMPGWLWRLWYTAFLAKCGYYYVLDKIDRSRLNIVFYRSYAGLPAGEIKRQVPECYRDVIRPRQFRETEACVAHHREAGHRIVFVTGSLDFIIEPLAEQLGAHDVVAPSLSESNGRFTGALTGPPVGEEEKARRIRQFAAEQDIDLADSHAYGDSINDLPMLEVVGFPHAVNPDRALASIAAQRGWPIHRWTLPDRAEGNGR